MQIACEHYQGCLPEAITIKRVQSISKFLGILTQSIVIHQLPCDPWPLRALGVYSVSGKLANAPWNWVNAVNRAIPIGGESRDWLAKILEHAGDTGRPVLLLGSGPSLTNFAKPVDDVLVIGANSLVANHLLLQRFSPDILVASDAAMHFSETAHAVSFRQKLVAYLEANPKVKFVYPQTYDSVAQFHLSNVKGQLVPIPTRLFSKNLRSAQRLGKLPVGENVLSSVLLPVALATKPFGPIYFAGFDGQPPGDVGVWQSESSLRIVEGDNMVEEYPALHEFWATSRMSETDFPPRFLRQFKRLVRAGVEMESLTPSHHTFLQLITPGPPRFR